MHAHTHSVRQTHRHTRTHTRVRTNKQGSKQIHTHAQACLVFIGCRLGGTLGRRIRKMNCHTKTASLSGETGQHRPTLSVITTPAVCCCTAYANRQNEMRNLARHPGRGALINRLICLQATEAVSVSQVDVVFKDLDCSNADETLRMQTPDEVESVTQIVLSLPPDPDQFCQCSTPPLFLRSSVTRYSLTRMNKI